MSSTTSPLPMSTSARRYLPVLIALPALIGLGWVLLGGRAAAPLGAAREASAARAAGATTSRATPPELAVPEEAPQADARRSGALQAEPRREARSTALGGLAGRVRLDASFDGARCVAVVVRRETAEAPGPDFEVVGEPRTFRSRRDSRGVTRRVDEVRSSRELVGRGIGSRLATSEPLFGPDFELWFEGLEPGSYELRLSVVPEGWPEDPVANLAAHEEPFWVVADLEVTAGETLRDPRLDPLDLRERFVLARYTLVDGFGVSRAHADCRAHVSQVVRAESRTDAAGNVDFVLAARSDALEIELEGVQACIARAAVGAGRSVVVVPDRPTYVLRVDPRELREGCELSVFVRESESSDGESPLGRGAVWGRFDAAGDALVTPRRLGRHELEWRVKRPDRPTTARVDPRQTLEVRAGAHARVVELELPDEVREALR